MDLIFVNKTPVELEEDFLTAWVESVIFELGNRKVNIPEDVEELILVFVNPEEMTSLNSEFRDKNKVTDVLSFAPVEESSLGELIFCVEQIEIQAKDHDLSYKQELAYMCLHGILHLLGFEHEQGGEEEKIMFGLQDSIFEKLSEEYF